MHNLYILSAHTGDLEHLKTVGRATFLETFAADNTAENMQKYLEERFSTDQLYEELTDENSEFYLSWLDSEVVGYMKLNFSLAQTEAMQEDAMEIERIYVLQAFQGKKVGQLLLKEAIQIAKRANVEYVWLGVWEKNTRAIHFYKKNGFVPFSQHIFKLGDDEQLDILMKLPLR